MARDKDINIGHSYFNKFQYMALRSFKEALQYKEDIQKILKKDINLSDDDSFTIARLNGEIEICGIQTIICCTLALESFINSYAAQKLSREYLEKYLDRLDHLSKWIVIPRLASGSLLDPESMAIKNLKTLITTRDRLLQSRVKQKFANRFKSIDSSWIEDAEFAIKTVCGLLKDLAGADKSVKSDWATKPNPVD